MESDDERKREVARTQETSANSFFYKDPQIVSYVAILIRSDVQTKQIACLTSFYMLHSVLGLATDPERYQEDGAFRRAFCTFGARNIACYMP